MSTLQFSDYEFEKYGYMKAPEPKLNGGLYSGEAFNGKHGNVKVLADGEYMTTKNLKSANPPTEGLYHYPGYTRPGNNKQELPGTKQYSNIHSFRCLSNKELLKRKNRLNGSNGSNGSNEVIEGFKDTISTSKSMQCPFVCRTDVDPSCPCPEGNRESPCFGLNSGNFYDYPKCIEKINKYCKNPKNTDTICVAFNEFLGN
jgi:hypothetical protein